MSIDNSKEIDFVSLNSIPDTALLVVSDHLDWSDTLWHQLKLQEKLNTYLAFIENGELLMRFPKAKNKRVMVRVIFQYQPDRSGEEFLAKVNGAFKAAGFAFSYQVGVTEPDPHTIN